MFSKRSHRWFAAVGTGFVAQRSGQLLRANPLMNVAHCGGREMRKVTLQRAPQSNLANMDENSGRWECQDAPLQATSMECQSIRWQPRTMCLTKGEWGIRYKQQQKPSSSVTLSPPPNVNDTLRLERLSKSVPFRECLRATCTAKNKVRI